MLRHPPGQDRFHPELPAELPNVRVLGGGQYEESIGSSLILHREIALDILRGIEQALSLDGAPVAIAQA